MKKLFWTTLAVSITLARFDDLSAVGGAFAILVAGGLWLVIGLLDVADAGEEGRIFWTVAAAFAAVIVVGFWLTPAAPVVLGMIYWMLADPIDVALFFAIMTSPIAGLYIALWFIRASLCTGRLWAVASDPTFYRRSIIRPQ